MLGAAKKSALLVREGMISFLIQGGVHLLRSLNVGIHFADIADRKSRYRSYISSGEELSFTKHQGA